MSSPSQKTRQHDEPLLLILVSELLAVGLLLAPAPGIHKVRADDDEDDERRGAGDEDDADPSDDLKHVIRTGDEGEAEAGGDLAGGLAGLAQRGEVPVDVCVGELAAEVEAEAEDVEGRGEERFGAGGGGEGGVDLEGAEEAGEDPVEERVAHDEGRGHRVGAELVHEDDLELPLDEVRRDHGEGGLLHRREGAGAKSGSGRRRDDALEVGVDGWVEVVADGGEEGVEDERAEVLAEVDESPGDLGACSMLEPS